MKVDIKTTKSQLDIEIENAMNESKFSKGISFYCSKRHKYIFISNPKIIKWSEKEKTK